MKLKTFNQTDKGAVMTFTGATPDEVSRAMADYLALNGFKLEGGTPLNGTWGSGSAGARLIAGGLSGRKKYNVSITGTDPVSASVSSGMSGWSGSVLGAVKEKR